MTEHEGPFFISVRAYSQQMSQSESLTRKQVKAHEIRHIRSGDRILIPAGEPRRKYDEAISRIEQAEGARD